MAESSTVRQMVFLVGGKGTRLGSLTADTPKPLLEIAPGLRFLDVLIEDAARQGFTDIILLAGHLGDQVSAAYDGRSFRDAQVSVIREPTPAGTGGALLYAAHRLDAFFLMANGDSLFEINLRALAAQPDPGIVARLALRQVPDVSRYGAVELEGRRIIRFMEKRPDAGAGLINGGVYLMNRRILDGVSGPCSIESDIFPGLAASGQLQGEVHHGYFLDIGLPDTFATARAEVPLRRCRPAVFLGWPDLFAEVPPAGARDLPWNHHAARAIKQLNGANYLVFLAAPTAPAFALREAIAADLAPHGAHLDAIYGPEGAVEAAMADWEIRLDESFEVRTATRSPGAALGGPMPIASAGDLSATVQAILEDARRPDGRQV